MSKYLDAERELAQLLHPGRDIKGVNILHIDTPEGKKLRMPMWTRDYRVSFCLITDYELTVSVCPTSVRVSFNTDGKSYNVAGGTVTQLYKDHTDKEMAVMFAIVQAVINKLKSEKEKA